LSFSVFLQPAYFASHYSSRLLLPVSVTNNLQAAGRLTFTGVDSNCAFIIFIHRSHGRWIQNNKKCTKKKKNIHTQQSSSAYLLHQCCNNYYALYTVLVISAVLVFLFLAFWSTDKTGKLFYYIFHTIVKHWKQSNGCWCTVKNYPLTHSRTVDAERHIPVISLWSLFAHSLVSVVHSLPAAWFVLWPIQITTKVLCNRTLISLTSVCHAICLKYFGNCHSLVHVVSSPYYALCILMLWPSIGLTDPIRVNISWAAG